VQKYGPSCGAPVNVMQSAKYRLSDVCVELYVAYFTHGRTHRSPGQRAPCDLAVPLFRSPEPSGTIPGAVSGFTIRSGRSQSPNHRLARIQKRRSALIRRGRGYRRCSTNTCCRKQRFSAINSVRGLNIAAMAHSRSRNTRPPAQRCLAGAFRRRLVDAKGPPGYFCAYSR
jgi:hypothetical protein